MELKEKLVALRKEKGLTQLVVAEKLNVSRQAISRWESGTALPSTDNLRCLGALYEVPIDYLVNEETERPISEDDSRQDENKQKHKRVLRIVAAFISVALIVAGGGLLCGSFWGKENGDNTNRGLTNRER